jgi:hypothetical protein
MKLAGLAGHTRPTTAPVRFDPDRSQLSELPAHERLDALSRIQSRLLSELVENKYSAVSWCVDRPEALRPM